VRKVFIKNLLFLQILNLIVKPVWLLLIDRMAQNLLGPVYGEYYLVLNLTLITNIFLDLGIQNFNNTSIAADSGFFKTHFKGIFILKSLLSSIYILLVLFLGIQSGMPQDLLLVLIGNQVLTTFILYLRTNINGLHRYTTDSLLSVSDKFFGILICIVFYLLNKISIMHFAIAQFMASSVTFIIALLINIKLWRNLPSLAAPLEKGSLKFLIQRSLPYALLFTLMNFYTRMDVTMMNWLLPDAVYHGGLYAQSFRLLDAAAMFAMLFAGLLLPMFARMISEKTDLRPLANLASTVLLLISITVAMGAQFFGKDILDAMYKFRSEANLLESTAVFKNIMLTFVPMSVTFVFSTLLTAKKDIWHMNIYAASAFLCNFLINYLLIPEYKSFGASIGSLCTQSVFALFCVWRSFKLFDFNLPIKQVLRFLVWIVLLIAAYFFVKSISNLWLALFAYGIAAILFSALLNILDFKKIMQIFDKTSQ
jgi:O-antigen/teichoic acid export membrane protein